MSTASSTATKPRTARKPRTRKPVVAQPAATPTATEPTTTATEPTTTTEPAELETAPAETPAAPPNPHLVRADRMLRQLARYGVEQDGAFARMVQCEAAWWVVQQLVARGMLPADDAQALLYEGTEHVVADFLTAVEEQRLVRAKAPQQQHSAPRRALAQALDRAAAVGERRTPGGIVY